MSKSHLSTANGSLVTSNMVLFNAYGRQYRVGSSNKSLYDKVVALIKDGKTRACVTAINEDKVKSEESKSRVTVKGDSVFIDGVAFTGNATAFARVFARAKASGASTAALSLFFENIADNKNQSSINGIIDFVTNNKIAITDRGTLLAYKKVKPNFMDIHSGTMCNRPGETLQLPADRVDFNAQNECSSGLHFCGYDYLKDFGSDIDRVVVCEVDPKHIAAVPKDYGFRKARTKQYSVVCTLEAFRTILSTSTQDAIGEQPVFLMATLDGRDLITGIKT